MSDLEPEMLDQANAAQLRHLVNLIRARLTLQQNIDDGALADNAATHPIYLVDSNVLHLFFNPRQNHHLVQLFSPRGKASRTQIETAIITGQFLFSGRLPGQRLLPLYLDPGHLMEFRQSLSATLQRLNEAAADAQGADHDRDAEAFRKAITAVKRQLTLARKNRTALQKVSEEHIPNLIKRFNLGAASAARQLLDLSSSDKIRPLRLAPGVDKEVVDHPDKDAVDRWEELLIRAERSSAQWSLEAQNRRTRNRRRDAECLARIELINEGNSAKGQPERLHLITSDEVIHSAVELAKDKSGGTMAEVRRTSQYLPVFNTEDMDNQVHRADATTRLRDAIDTFLREARQSGEQPQDVLTRLYNRTRALQQMEGDMRAWLAQSPEGEREQRLRRVKALLDNLKKKSDGKILSSLTPLMGDGLATTLPSIERHWDALAKNAVFLNVHLLVRYHQALLQGIEDAFEEARRGETATALAEVYESKQISISSDLDKSHLQTAMRNALILALDSLNRRASLTFSARAPASLVNSAGAHLPTHIVRDAGGQDDARLKADITDLCHLDSADFRDVQLGCAAVALQLGAWSTTCNIAERLITDLRSDQEVAGAATEEGTEPRPIANAMPVEVARKLGDALFLRASGLRALVWVDYEGIYRDKDGAMHLQQMLGSGQDHLAAAEAEFERIDDALGLAQIKAAKAMHLVTRLLLAAVLGLDSIAEDEGDLLDLASNTIKAARDAMDAGSAPELTGVKDLADREFAITLKAKASIAALLCRLAVRQLDIDMPSAEAVHFPRFQAEVEVAIQAEDDKRLRFHVWKVILALSKATDTQEEALTHRAAWDTLRTMLSRKDLAQPEENLEIAFLLRHSREAQPGAALATV